MFDKFGAFVASLLAFFIIEIGDRTQVATIALAAHYQSVVVVTIVMMLGMMVADVPRFTWARSPRASCR